MVEIERIDKDLFKSSHLTFRDDGPVSKGAKTRQFSVFSSSSRALLGYVKWWTSWRQYCFFPLNSLFDPKCLRQIAQFCEEATAAHKSRLPLKKHEKKLMLARRQRRMAQLAARKEQAVSWEDDGSDDYPVSDLIDMQTKASVVEGSQDLTPLEVELGTIDF